MLKMLKAEQKGYCDNGCGKNLKYASLEFCSHYCMELFFRRQAKNQFAEELIKEIEKFGKEDIAMAWNTKSNNFFNEHEEWVDKYSEIWIEEIIELIKSKSEMR